MNIFDAIILSVVEGLTEFLPVSSTGHMILTSKILGLEQNNILKCFEVVIQLGSILAVVCMFFNRLKQDFKLWTKLIIAFLPTAIIGFLFYSHIKKFFSPQTTSYMLIFWGVIFIIVELFLQKKGKEFTKIHNINDISYKKAFLIGFSQCFAMIPGTSRSGATIISSLLLGIDRGVAATFSFLLAIPTMLSATAYDVYKNYEIFSQNSQNFTIFTIGAILAFIVAFVSIKLFLNFVSKFNYIPFGIYRIIIGIVFLLFII